MTDKTFDMAGVSRLNGVLKPRFATGEGRDKVLLKNGHTEICFVDLPHPMVKGDALLHLLTSGFQANNEEVIAVIKGELKKRGVALPEAVTAPPTVVEEVTGTEEVPEAVDEATGTEGADEQPEAIPETTDEEGETPAKPKRVRKSRAKVEEAAE